MRRSGRDSRRQSAGCALALAACAVLPLAATAAQDDAGAALYRWQDRRGVVRYTPDLNRIPVTRRDTAVKVVPGTTPSGVPLGRQTAVAIPTPGGPSASSIAPAPPPIPGADPFNAPGELVKVETEDVEPGTPAAGSSWPELDERIAELEALIARDEETIKAMISQPRSGEDSELIHSAELREVAARLPLLQGELIELRSWREQPDDPVRR